MFLMGPFPVGSRKVGQLLPSEAGEQALSDLGH